MGEPIQPRTRQHYGVEIFTLDLRDARRHVAAQRYDLQIGSQREELGAAAAASGPNARSLAQTQQIGAGLPRY